MQIVPRALEDVLRNHLSSLRQMAFVSGPRRVETTTVCRRVGEDAGYLNWDDRDDREVLLAGPGAVADHLDLSCLREEPPVVVFDELHRYRRWRTFLEGFFDHHADRVRIIVTGSARFDVFRPGVESPMGRYFLHRLHPLSVGELLHPHGREKEIGPPGILPGTVWDALCRHGGFPEPYSHSDDRFSRRWRRLRGDLLVRHDVRDLTRIQEIDQLEILVRVLGERSGTRVNYTSLARQVRTSVDTMPRWIGALCDLHYGFLLRPWHRSVSRSLPKEPRWFLRDWSSISTSARGRRLWSPATC
jgi:predicted AAA+ superfamily ATPase